MAMQEIKFEGISFEPLIGVRRFTPLTPTLREGMELNGDIVLGEPVLIGNDHWDSIWEGVEDPVQVVERYKWSFDDLKFRFNNVSKTIEKRLGVNLGLDKIRIMQVKPESLLPKDEEAKKRLVERYGESILDGIAGACTEVINGRFLLRIGCKGKEEEMTDIRVLEVMSHELGHTLGVIQENPVDEELKAYAFRSLFMRFLFDSDYYEDNFEGLSGDRLHHVSLDRLRQLIVRGISEEEIISQLTGMPFGQYMPDDYLKKLKVDRATKRE